ASSGRAAIRRPGGVSYPKCRQSARSAFTRPATATISSRLAYSGNGLAARPAALIAAGSGSGPPGKNREKPSISSPVFRIHAGDYAIRGKRLATFGAIRRVRRAPPPDPLPPGRLYSSSEVTL